MSDMWLTYAAVLFGIAVAIAVVAAYLRLTRAAKRSDGEQEGEANPAGPRLPNRREDG